MQVQENANNLTAQGEVIKETLVMQRILEALFNETLSFQDCMG